MIFLVAHAKMRQGLQMSWQLYVLSISPRLFGPDAEELVGSA